MGGRKDLITAGLTLGALADAAAKAKGKMSAIIAAESGAVVSFTAADAAPVADLTAAIVPVQDLHGQSSPYPPGGGKNKLPYPYYSADGVLSGITFSTDSDGKITATGTTDDGVNYFLARDMTLQSGTYTVSITGTHTGLTLIARDPVNSVILGDITPQETSTTFTITETTSVRLYLNTSIVGVSVSISAYIQLEDGSSPTSWTPYSNICPITGYIGVNVTRAGKNLLNPAYKGSSMSSNGCTLTVEEDGTITINRASSTGYNSAFYLENRDYLKYFPSGIYAFAQEGFALPGTGGDSIIQATTRDKNSDVITHRYYLNGSVPSVVFELSANDYISDVFVRIKSTDSPDNMNVKIQLERGSSVTSFEPYQGTTYTVSFGEVGTVYGGTLDVTTGTLTVDRASIASYAGETLPGAWISDRDVYAAGITPTIGAQVVYELATPIVYNLTPVEIRTLAGQNTIWADTGNVTVKYTADTKAFIDKYIAARRNG